MCVFAHERVRVFIRTKSAKVCVYINIIRSKACVDVTRKKPFRYTYKHARARARTHTLEIGVECLTKEEGGDHRIYYTDWLRPTTRLDKMMFYLTFDRRLVNILL